MEFLLGHVISSLWQHFKHQDEIWLYDGHFQNSDVLIHFIILLSILNQLQIQYYYNHLRITISDYH